MEIEEIEAMENFKLDVELNNKEVNGSFIRDLDIIKENRLIEDITESFVRTKEFDDIYYYEGDLGNFYSKEKTDFILWAPTANKVFINIYKDLEEKSSIDKKIEMKKGLKGTFIATIYEDLDNVSYTYTLICSNGNISETGDPYGRACTINGKRTVVVDPDSILIEDFNRMPSFSNNVDAIIYEMHIRDFSISNESGIKNKGKFIGVIEEGTTNSLGDKTGLDYLKDIGITHVQILPMYDFDSVNENNDGEYNWGYDPLNYNIPEGSYSLNPKDPKARIIEMKKMIKGLHDNNIRVIMDVVYNHVYEVNNHPFHKTVPGYFFRYDDNGNLINGTGVGNDTASERKMMRKYMVDSLLYLAKEYKLDGFRFDLMGIHDIDTMVEIKDELKKIDPGIILLGEGWDLNTGLNCTDKATLKNACKLENIAFFNDSIRDCVKGNVFSLASKGFIHGINYVEDCIIENSLGGQNLDSSHSTFISPNQVIQYAEAHDNYTMYDKLKYSYDNYSLEEIKDMQRLGTSIVLLSQGVPFIHAGQEFLRTKNGVENSYKSNDEINKIDWLRVTKNKTEVDYFKGLVEIRKDNELLRMSSYEAINNNSKLIKKDDLVVAYELSNNREKLIVIFNAGRESKYLTLDKEKYDILVNKEGASINGLGIITGNNIEIKAISTLVLKKRG